MIKVWKDTSGDLSPIYCKQGQRSLNIHMVLLNKLQESPQPYRRSEQVTRLHCDYTGTLSLPPSLLPRILSVCWPPGVRRHALFPSAPVLKLRRKKLGDRWIGEGGVKIGVGKINSQVSSDSSWVSFISIRLTKSLSTTEQHTLNQQIEFFLLQCIKEISIWLCTSSAGCIKMIDLRITDVISSYLPKTLEMSKGHNTIQKITF